MSEGKNHISFYSAEDIESYFEGRLSPSRMHSMEKAALEDPFLAEAMEGFGVSRGINWKPQLESLRGHFTNAQTPAKVVAMKPYSGRWWKVAAAVLVIGCGATLTYVLTKKNRQTDVVPVQQVAKAQPGTNENPAGPTNVIPPSGPTVKNEVAVSKNDIHVSNGDVATDSAQVLAKLKTQNPPRQSTNITPITNNGTEVVKTEVQPPANIAPQVNAQSNSTDLLTSAIKEAHDRANAYAYKKVTVEESNRAVASKAKMNTDDKIVMANKPPSLTHTFIAQVVGPDNTPLPFANVSIKQDNFGTYADVKGGFKLVSADSVINVEVKSVGYLPRNYTLRSDMAQNTIVLSEDANTAMERAVVVNDEQGSSKILRRARVLKDSSYINVEPADGWENYNAYIANNIEIPQDAFKKNLHGEVEISFKVNANGSITDINIDKSNCSDCNELAKRLVEQGPQWKVKKGLRKSSGKIKVQF